MNDMAGERSTISDGCRVRWEHFEHDADIGIRGYGTDVSVAFEHSALALIGVMCDPGAVRQEVAVEIVCEAPDLELLLLDWLNALIYEMSTRGIIFGGFIVRIADRRLTARCLGESIDPGRHQPAVEIKAATMTGLRVYHDGACWVAQCVVDV